MGELKKHQPALTIDEQIENLKSIGLIINDEDKAKQLLKDISYFRLIKGFSINLKPKNGNYHKGTTFEHILLKNGTCVVLGMVLDVTHKPSPKLAPHTMCFLK